MTAIFERLREFRRPWEFHPFHTEIGTKTGFENVLMQRGNTTQLTEQLLASFEGEELIRVQRALTLAESIHGNQMREDGTTPHLNHVLRLSLRTIEAARTKEQHPNILLVLTDLLHDTEEDLQHIHAVPQTDFREAFYAAFADEPLVREVYGNIHALNKYRRDGTPKADEEYYQDITKRGLWNRKVADREDSLIGDIARAMTNKRGKSELQRVRKSLRKAEKTYDAVSAVDKSAIGRLPDVITYAYLFVGDKPPAKTSTKTIVHGLK